MLDYFAWFDKFLKSGIEEVLIWDASCYSIVNKINRYSSRETYSVLSNEPSAKQVMDCLIKEQEKNSRDFLTNCQLREQYFRKFIEVLEINVSYLNSWNVFREDDKFIEALEKSLEFVNFLDKNNPELIKKINFNKTPDAATRLYLPLEIAEAVYLEETRNIKTKFGPISEQFFDIAIEGMFEQLGLGYSTLRCNFTPGTDRPAYLMTKGGGRILGSKSSYKTIRKILRFNPELAEYLDSVCEQFKGKYDDGSPERLARFLRRISMQLEGKKEQIRGRKKNGKKK